MVARLCVVLLCLNIAIVSADSLYPHIQVSWVASPDATATPRLGYRLFRACDEHTLEWRWLIDLSPETTTYHDTSVGYSQRCCYKIFAFYEGQTPIAPKTRKTKASPLQPPMPNYRLSIAMPEQCDTTRTEPPLPGPQKVQVSRD